MVNIERVMKNLHTIGEIGAVENKGITREGFSKEYYNALDKLENLFKKSSLEITKDRVGNIIGKRKGKKIDGKSILIGSHLDTVKNGGLYDGLLGVISALEVVNVLNDLNIETNNPIEIVAFNAEEGSEMGGTFGSRVLTGRQSLEEKGLSEKLSHYNLTLEDIIASQKDMSKVNTFLELHIEQGGFLVENNLDIGIVNGIVGITRYEIEIIGESNHAGTTPMTLRKDPIKILGKFIEKINNLSQEFAHPFVVTIGDIKVSPGMYNVIPEKVKFLLELRDLNQENIEIFMKRLKDFSEEFTDFETNFLLTINKPSKLLTDEIIKFIEKSAKELEYKNIIMSSGAGHDAKELIYKVPTGMIFIPSVGGISHSPKELSTENQIEKGIEVLLKTVLKLDKEVYV